MSIIFKIEHDNKWYYTLVTDLTPKEKEFLNIIKYVDKDNHNIRYCNDIEKLSLLITKFFKIKNIENFQYENKGE